MNEATTTAAVWNADEEYWKVREGKSEIRSYTLSDPEHAALLSRLLEEDIGRFAKLAPEQMTEEFAKPFVASRLQATDFAGAAKMYFETLDEKSALHLAYASGGDEVIEYFDPDLELPTWLSVKFAVDVAIEDAMKLIRGINLAMNRFSMESVAAGLRTVLSETVRTETVRYLAESKMGYLHFGSCYDAIGAILSEKLAEKLSLFGLSVLSFHMQKISVSDQVDAMIREEYLNVRSLSTRAEAEARWAQASVEQLEKKCEIITKYQLPADTLTEMEKDKALERYLKKVNNVTDAKKKLADKPEEIAGKAGSLAPIKPVAPKHPEEINVITAKRVASFGIFAGLALVLAIIGFATRTTVLGIVGLVAAAALAIVAVVLFLKRRANAEVYAAHEAELAEYKHKTEAYEKELADYNAALKEYQATKKN